MFDQKKNSEAEPLPNTVPQAPSSIPVEEVDRGSRLPPMNPGGEPHGYGSQTDK